MTCSRSESEPNDWIEYVDRQTREVLHIDAFYNPDRIVPRQDMPPGYKSWSIS